MDSKLERICKSVTLMFHQKTAPVSLTSSNGAHNISISWWYASDEERCMRWRLEDVLYWNDEFRKPYVTRRFREDRAHLEYAKLRYFQNNSGLSSKLEL